MPGNEIVSNSYLTTSGSTQAWTYDLSTSVVSPYYTVDASVSVKGTKVHPELYFKYIKSKFKPLERIKLNRRVKAIEKAFYKAVDVGQELLAQKIMNELGSMAKEAVIAVKGVKYYIEIDDIRKHKNNINGGHISDTMFADYTRVIPDKVLKRKKELEGVFDGYIIYHYWNEKAKDVKKMDEREKAKMKDPVLFGMIKETNRLYFIADWQDEYCDLSFAEICEVIGKENV